jgi:hypothetical protein
MGTQLILGLMMLAQATTTPPAQPLPTVSKAPDAVVVQPPARCDARPYQRLVGRTMSDLLTARLPPNTRIYRIDDPITQAVQTGRLSVEINRSTRVRRVYCS